MLLYSLILAMVLAMVLFAYLGYKRPFPSLFISLTVMVGFFIFVSLYAEQSKFALFAPFIFLVTLIAILVSKREADSDQTPQRVAKWILIISIFILLSIISFALTGYLGFLGVLFVILLSTLVISYGLTSRNTTAAYILSTIGASMRQNMPLTTALEFASAGREDTRSRTLRRIKKWLVEGYSLSEAIKKGYPKCPGSAVAMIAAAERTNQLPLAFGAIEKDMVAKADKNRRVRPVHPFYPVILMTFVLFTVMVLTRFVFPAFTSVLEEMVEEDLPPATKFLAAISYQVGSFVWPVIFFIIVVVVPFSIYVFLRPRRPQKPYLVSRIGDFVKWHLPVVHWFENNFSMTQVVELLRLSLNSGCTIDQAVANTLNLDVNNCFKKRLRIWLKKITMGVDVSVAAKESKLGNTLAWAFDQQINKGNTPVILDTLENFYRSNYSYRVNLARFIMWPCVTIIMGLVVGFVVYSVYSPMVEVITYLAESIIP